MIQQFQPRYPEVLIKLRAFVIVNILATGFHLYHNVRYIDSVYFESLSLRYPLILGWFLLTLFGLFSFKYFKAGRITFALHALLLYSVLSLASLIHYYYFSITRFTLTANAGILSEALVAFLFSLYILNVIFVRNFNHTRNKLFVG